MFHVKFEIMEGLEPPTKKKALEHEEGDLQMFSGAFFVLCFFVLFSFSVF